MIQDTIDSINERIADQLPTEAVGISGIALPFQDQQEKTVGIRLLDSGERFSINDQLLWQSLHLSDGTSVASNRQFGSFTDTMHNARFVLIGLSKNQYWYDLAIEALRYTSYVVIDGHDQDTLSVLNRYFRVKTGQDKNYDPALHAFAIRYHIEGVTDEDLEELTKVQSALLSGSTFIPTGTAGPSELYGNRFPVYGQTSQSVIIGPNATSTFIENFADGYSSVIITMP